MALDLHPVALLPVRLEARFDRPQGAPGYDLHVRIYPDDCSVTTFEPNLTALERSDMTEFARTRSVESFGTLRTRHGLPRALYLGRLAVWGAPASVPNRDAVWTLPPRAALLPQRWLVVAYNANGDELARTVSVNVRAPLHAGPDPQRTSVPAPAGMPGDAGMHWMVNIDAAREAGMAVRLTLPPGVHVVDRLVAVGVRPDSPAAAGDLLGALIEEQAFSRGAGFLAPGTPTNNTEAVQSGFATDALSDADALQIVLRSPSTTPAAGTNNASASWALGAAGRFLGSLTDAERVSEGANEGSRRVFHSAVWSATWSYFLNELAPEAFAATTRAETIERGHRLFRDHVRARVPLPILRIGRQPYGLLPVTPLALWPAQGEHGELAAFLHTRLRPKWLDAAREAPRVGSGAEDLLAVLGLAPGSGAYRARSMVGDGYVGALWRFLRKPLGDEWRSTQTNLASAALQGLTWTPRIRSAVFSEHAFTWNGSLVQDEPVSAQPVGGDGGYLRWLATAGWRALRDDAGSPLPGARRPLLYLLLRQAVLRAYADGLAWLPDFAPRPTPEPELLDVDPVSTASAAQHTLWDILELPYRTGTVAEHLEQLTSGSVGTQTGPSPVRAVRDAILALADVSSATIESMLADALDLCSYRLDAWMSALAWKRLAALRAPAAPRTYVGAYGWLADLRPGTRQPSAGYVLAPSPAHAVAGGVLASGHLAHTRRAEKDNALAVDLSSARVSLAMWLLDGVRDGQRPAALLGYRFERRLLEGGLGQYVDPFRTRMPRVSGATAGATPSPGSVLDGIALGKLWAEAGRDRRVLQGAGPWPAIATAHVEDVARELDELDRAADAVADVLVAEGVFQLTQGNRARAAAALDAAAGTSAALPDPEFIRTPRSGVSQTHRVVVLFPAPSARPGTTARWRAEPRVATWTAQLLPRAQDVRVTGRWIDVKGEPVGNIDQPLASLVQNLEPIDLLYSVSGAERDAGGELSEFLRFRLLETRPSKVPADAVPVLQASDAKNAISLAEFGEIARALRELIRAARPITPADLSVAGEVPQAPIDDVAPRVDEAIAALTSVRDRLARAAAAQPPEPAALSRELFAAFRFGIPGAVPREVPAAAGAAEVLVAQALLVRAEADRRVTAAAAEKAGRWTAERGVRAIRHLFGDAFPFVPTFVAPTGATVADLSFAASTALQRNNAATAAGWLTRVARVHAGTRRLTDLFTYAEALQTGPSLRPQVAQLPARANDTWIALDSPPGIAPRAGTSLVAIVAEGFRRAEPLGGLLVDEWVEVVPASHETLGAAFHFDAPNATAPNAILLAVPPDGITAWDDGALALTVQQALEQSMIRAVDPDALTHVGHFLPALYFPVNMRGATVATDLFDARALPLT